MQYKLTVTETGSRSSALLEKKKSLNVVFWWSLEFGLPLPAVGLNIASVSISSVGKCVTSFLPGSQ